MAFKVTVEIPLFLVTFGALTTISVSNNLIIYRTCYALLHFNKTECALLGMVQNNITEYLEKQVEPYSDYINLVLNIMLSVVGSFLCLFIAPWSDRYGRKPILVIGLLGGTIATILHILFAIFDTLSPWYIMVVGLPTIITGGSATFMTVLSAYLTDTTTKEERGFRLGIFDIVMTIAILLGNTSSPYILTATSYPIVYCISAVCHIVSLIFTILFIPESLHEPSNDNNKIASLLKLSNVYEMFRTPFKEREQSKKKILLLIVAALVLTYLASGGDSLTFLFLRGKLGWTLKQYTWFGSVSSILGIIGTFFIVYLLHTVFKITETPLIILGLIFSTASLILKGLSEVNWQIYLAAIIGLPSAGQNAMIRSLISKLAHEDEIAKIFSVLSISSNLFEPISSTGYTALYNATLNSYPGIFNLVTAILTSICFFIFVAVFVIQSKSNGGEESDNSEQEYRTLDEENDEEEDEALRINANE